MASRKWWQLDQGWSHQSTSNGPVVWLAGGPRLLVSVGIGDAIKTSPSGQLSIVAAAAPSVGAWTEVSPPA